MPKSGRSKNAMKHGAYSRELILPGESRKQYQVLCAALEEEWEPAGPTETELVNRLASLIWRQRRHEVYEQSKLQKRLKSVQVSNEANCWRRVLQSLAPSLATATTFKEVEEILVTNEFSVAFIASKVPQPPADQEAKWGPTIAEYLDKMEIGKHLHGIDEFTAIVDPIEIELESLRSNRLQEDIDRAIKRLVQVKAYKQFLPGVRAGGGGSKLIDVSPNKAIETPNLGKPLSEVANVSPHNDNSGTSGNVQSANIPEKVEKDSKPKWPGNPQPLDIKDVVLRIT